MKNLYDTTRIRKYQSKVYIGETFEIESNGIEYIAEIIPDDCMGYPWDEHDGHGPVECRRSSSKRPGEIIILHSHSSCLFYDFQAAVKIAKRDGWSCDCATDDMTLGEKAEVAAFADLAYCSAFAQALWSWVGLKVLRKGDCPCCSKSESLFGIESFSGEDYFLELAKDLIKELEHEKQLAN